MLLKETHTEIEKDERALDRTLRPEAPASDSVPLTAGAHRLLERQLAILRDEKEREIPARLRAAREFGDTANNDEHLAIREDEAVLAARIARIEDILARAIVVERADADDSVAIGSEVAAVDIDTGQTLEYVIDGAHGAIIPRMVSPLSPVGRALIGRRVGDRVTVDLPNGRRRQLELREIRVPERA
jgi:transcription elongation factor GreA